MLHAWIPRRLYTDALHPARQIRGALTRAIWFAEGFPQYLAFVGMGRAGLCPTKEIMFMLARRFVVPLFANKPATARSMADRSLRLGSGDHDEWSYGFAQGALFAMWLDGKLRITRSDLDGLPEAMRALY